eukprot:3771303-Ditylum_brightwellii.AAC.1
MDMRTKETNCSGGGTCSKTSTIFHPLISVTILSILSIFLVSVESMTTLTSSSSTMRHTISKVTRKAAREAVEGRIVTIPNDVWRSDALNHDKRIRTLLGAGLMTSKDHSIDSKKHKKKQHQKDDGWTALDPKNPVYNFLIEYYGIKGAKGPRRLARWSPDPSLIFHQQTPSIPFEELLNELRTNLGHEKNDNGNNVLLERLQKGGGILLEDAIPDDI